MGQWYCFSRSCRASSKESRHKLIMYTILMQVFGLLGMYSPAAVWACLCHAVSSVCFVLMFAEGCRIPVDWSTDGLSGSILTLDLVLWAAYPLAFALRVSGIISVWVEQVCVYTILD